MMVTKSHTPACSSHAIIGPRVVLGNLRGPVRPRANPPVEVGIA